MLKPTFFFCRQAGLTQGMLQWRPTGALHFFFQASPGMRPARRQHLRPNPAAPTWLRRGLGPGADTKSENQKKNLPPKRQDSQVSLESPAAFSRPPPTSSTGLWQTRSERKPWNQRRKPREAYHPQGRAYEPEQQLASSCHVAATSQCMPVRACSSRRQLTIRAALAQLENIFVPPPEAHSWAHDKPQHSSAQPCKRSGCQKCMP